MNGAQHRRKGDRGISWHGVKAEGRLQGCAAAGAYDWLSGPITPAAGLEEFQGYRDFGSLMIYVEGQS